MRTIIIFLLLFVGYFSYAQDISLGVKAGYNASTFSGENTAHFTYRNAYHAGVAAEFNFSDFFSIQAESLYSVVGAKDNNRDYPVQYIAFPVYGRIFPTEFFSLDLGGQYAYLLDDTYHFANGDKASLGLHSSDYALLAGATYKIKKQKMFVQVHYVMGVSEVDKPGNWNNRLWQISLGYNFL